MTSEKFVVSLEKWTITSSKKSKSKFLFNFRSQAHNL